MRDQVVQLLCDVGLTRNEALAYVTLLEEPGVEGLTGYEVAARSGIPRSAVYTVLRKLESSGAAFPTGERPSRYLPTSPDRLLAQMQESNTQRFEHLGTVLDRMPKRAAPEPVWIVSRYNEVLERADQMIRGARSSVCISAWPRELAALEAAIAGAGARAELHRVLHVPTAVEAPPAGFSCWQDPPEAGDLRTGWAHKLLVVVDREQVLVGGAEPMADNHAVWTMNPSIVDVVINHVILDITLISRRTGRACGADVAPLMRPGLPAV
jgi:sugar-specific transcriptional regulator TrmB